MRHHATLEESISQQALLPLYAKFATSPKQDESNHYVYSLYHLQFLWLATCDDVDLSVRSSLLVHPKLDGFINDRLESLLPHSPPQSTNIYDGFVTATSRLTAVIKYVSLITQQTAKKQRCWDNVMSEIQALFLFASLTNCSNPADSPSDLLSNSSKSP